MKNSALKAALAAGAMLAPGSGAAYADALAMPAMSASLAANPSPITFDAGPLGNIYVSGALTGFASWQSNTVPGDRDFRWDLTNGQVMVQKTDGLIQFYVQAGEYDLLSLGTPTFSSNYITQHTFTALPQAYLKLALSDTLSVEAGKLPTLIGDEYTFSFENLNVERGLLWNQEPAVSRGVQVNYTMGPVAFNVSLNDGYYSNRYNWISGLATWTIDPANTLAFAGGGNVGSTAYSSFATPFYANNSEIFNLIYTYSNAPWTISPYVQYQQVPTNAKLGITQSQDSWGGAVLVNYNLNPNWNLSGRIEYVTSDNHSFLLYGPNSSAWSFTITPTYQYKVFFARAEASYVTADNATPFGSSFAKKDQARLMLETGVVF